MGILPIFLYSFSKRYTGSAPGANVSVIGLNAIRTTGWPPPFAQLSFFEASISALGGLNDREPAAGSIAALLFRTGRWSSRSGSRETPAAPAPLTRANPRDGFRQWPGRTPVRQFRWRHAGYARRACCLQTCF